MAEEDLLCKSGVYIPRADPNVDAMCFKFYGVPGWWISASMATEEIKHHARRKSREGITIIIFVYVCFLSGWKPGVMSSNPIIYCTKRREPLLSVLVAFRNDRKRQALKCTHTCSIVKFISFTSYVPYTIVSTCVDAIAGRSMSQNLAAGHGSGSADHARKNFCF